MWEGAIHCRGLAPVRNSEKIIFVQRPMTKWETIFFYTPQVLGGAALFDNSAAVI